jgi:hypothetical protein
VPDGTLGLGGTNPRLWPTLDQTLMERRRKLCGNRWLVWEEPETERWDSIIHLRPPTSNG